MINSDDKQRPWGNFEILDDSDTFKVKKVLIKPGQRLSYQKHFKREEFWFIVEGEALVTLDDQEYSLVVGDKIHIPIEAKHRIQNKSLENNLVFIEVQLGTYFGEDDIERFSDDYGRS